MKRWIIAAALLVVLFIASTYIFIPSQIIVARSITATANPLATYRFLANDSNWASWWPGSAGNAANADFESGGYQFRKTSAMYESFDILISKGESTEKSLLYLFSLGLDSTRIKWSTAVSSGNNPFGRIKNYLTAEETGGQMEDILSAMQKYISNVKNLYGIDIRKEKVKIGDMVSITRQIKRPPGTGDIYDMIRQMKNYISQSQALEVDAPITHTTPLDNGYFSVLVAVPVDRFLPGKDSIVPKKMLKGGDILVSDVTGGKSKIDSVMKLMDQYVSDHRNIRIAVPFQSLVTDRSNEPDSSKWFTKVYFPII